MSCCFVTTQRTSADRIQKKMRTKRRKFWLFFSFKAALCDFYSHSAACHCVIYILND